MTKPLPHEEMLELAERREKENAFNALDRLYDENDETLRRLAMNESGGVE